MPAVVASRAKAASSFADLRAQVCSGRREGEETHGDFELIGKGERGKVVALQSGGRVAYEAAQDVRRNVKFVDTLTIGMAGIIREIRLGRPMPRK